MNACRDEPPHHSERPLACSGKVLGVGLHLIEDDLMAQLLTIVEVDERLMRRVVREHPGVHRQHTGSPSGRVDRPDQQRLPLGQRFQPRPHRVGQRPAVRGQPQSGIEQRDDARVLGREEGRFQQTLGGIDAQFVRNVDDVHDQRDTDRIVVQPCVEIAEWHLVGGRWRGRHQQYQSNPGTRQSPHRWKRSNGNVSRSRGSSESRPPPTSRCLPEKPRSPAEARRSDRGRRSGVLTRVIGCMAARTAPGRIASLPPACRMVPGRGPAVEARAILTVCEYSG